MEHVAIVIPQLVWLVMLVAIAGFGLAMPGVRGKVLIAIFALSGISVSIWYVTLNLLLDTQGIQYETYAKLNAASPLLSLLTIFGGVCLFLFVASQSAGTSCDFWRILFSFQGRISRQQYWISTVALGFISLTCFGSYLGELFKENSPRTSPISQVTLTIAIVISVLWSLASIWPSLAIQVKRWHDRDRSGWMVLINLIPVIGPIWTMIELGFLPGSQMANKFGENPLQPTATPTLLGTQFRPIASSILGGIGLVSFLGWCFFSWVWYVLLRWGDGPIPSGFSSDEGVMVLAPLVTFLFYIVLMIRPCRAITALIVGTIVHMPLIFVVVPFLLVRSSPHWPIYVLALLLLPGFVAWITYVYQLSVDRKVV